MARKFPPLYLGFALILVLTPLLTIYVAPVAAASQPVQFAYVATDGSLHLRDAAGGDFALSGPNVYSTTLQVDEYQSAYADVATFSPDGRYLAYRPSEGGTLTVVDVNMAISSGFAAATRFSQANAMGQLAFSPNSRYLAFETASSNARNESNYLNADSLMVVDLSNGSIKKSLKGAGAPLGWSADGKLAYASGPKVLVGQSDNKGSFRDIASIAIADSKIRVDSLTWSANNKNLAITVIQPDYSYDVYLGNVGVKGAALIAKNADFPQWTADGKAFFYRKISQQGASRNSYNVYFRPLGGKPISLGILLDSYSSYNVAPFSLNGNYVFNNLLVSPAGKVVGKLWPQQGDNLLGWSPTSSSKGALVAIEVDKYGETDTSGSHDTRSLQVIAAPTGQVSSIYTTTGFVDAGPSIKLDALWSPDGSHLAFYAMGGINAESGEPISDSYIGIVSGGNPAAIAKFDYAMPRGWLDNQTALFQDLNVDEHAANQAIYRLSSDGTAQQLTEGVFLAMRPSK